MESLYAGFLLHICYTLTGTEWDKPALLKQQDVFSTVRRLYQAMDHSVLAAECLKQVLQCDSDCGFKNAFFGIFSYHGCTLPWVAMAELGQDTSPKMLDTYETYVRVLEASNCTNYAEYLRKMRRLILIMAKETTLGMELSKAERHLRNQILKLYGWSADGTGLAL